MHRQLEGAQTMRAHALRSIACVAALSFAAIASAAEPELVSVSIEQPGVDDLSHLLRVRKISGRFELNKPVTQAALVLEVYKDGKKVPDAPSLDIHCEFGNGGTAGRFSLQAADLDYLRLDKAKDGHCRVLLGMTLAHEEPAARAMALGHTDVPKSTVDFSRLTAFATANWKQAEGERRPLFTLGGPEARRLSSSVERSIEANPEAEIVIGYLEFSE